MIAAHHLISAAYGWWLPNDPRGSTSTEIRVVPLQDLGPIHLGRKLQQPSKQELKGFYDLARDQLKHEILFFSDDAITVIGTTIAKMLVDNNYTCYACAVMPEHVHLLIRRHRDHAEEMLEKFQDATRNALIAAGLGAVTHPVWGGPGWKVFQNSPEQIRRTIRYIENNPEKAGRPRQNWGFVNKYDGWMPWCPGHH